MLDGKHGPCPICGEGKDRFRFDDKEGRGTWFCSQCEPGGAAGDGIDFVKRLHNVDFKGAAALIEPLLGTAAVEPARKAPSEEDKRRWMNDLWNGAQAIEVGDPAGMWLRTRAGVEQVPPVLRYHDSARHPDGGGSGPAMLAKITDADGRPVNIHRTFLDFRGEKAAIESQRAPMPGTLPEGCAVRLMPHGEDLGVAEGIETAFAAAKLHDVPCWSTMNATMLAKWRPPRGVKRVIVFGDNDRNYAGQHAAYQLGNRLSVRDKLQVDVCIPTLSGDDWRDVWVAAAAQRKAA